MAANAKPYSTEARRSWIAAASVTSEGVVVMMFIKRYPTYPERAYNEMAALTISIYYYKDLFCELEPIGPMENIAPGESASFTEEWWLLPFKFPGQDRKVNLDEITQKVNQLRP